MSIRDWLSGNQATNSGGQDAAEEMDVDALLADPNIDPSLRAQLERVTQQRLLVGPGDRTPEKEIWLPAMYDIALEAEQSGAPLETVRGLYLKAAEAGHLEAMARVAQLASAARDSEMFETWIVRAAQAGHVDSMHAIGQHQLNNGNFAAASTWLNGAAKTGLTDAEHDLGFLYIKLHNYDVAEHWLRLSAGKGHVPSMNKLGFLMYEQGRIELAHSWWAEAAEKGDEHAAANLNMLRTEGHI